MVDYNLLNEIDTDGAELDSELSALFGGSMDDATITCVIEKEAEALIPGMIMKGRVVGLAGDDFVVDVGLKSEGLVPVNEWDGDQPDVGDEVDVLLETIESESGLVMLSKRKADRQLNWQRIVDTHDEGDKVAGKVMRKIKGGLLVDIGVPVFLPASQVDIRRPADIGEYIGREIDARILKIDTDRRNIVISRRRLIEGERHEAKEKLLEGLTIGDVVKGVVKNIAEFGAFVDLGGIDGLLHITDMSWDRIAHPSDLVKIDEELEIKVLNIDKEKEKIALGLKQLKENPWETIEASYPLNSRVKGEVVNIMNYGAFIKLEPGVEGLVHISEMSWTRRINHPSELISVADEIEVIVLDINKNKQEISLGLKQTEVNPWTQVAKKYPPNTKISGEVRNLTNYGAFVEIEAGIDGLLHVSDMSWTKKISHPSEILKKSQAIECVVLKVEEDKQRIALGLKQLHEDPWVRAVPENYIPGQVVEGTVTKITNFGVFVELEDDLEGLLHISELADHKIEDPHEVVKIGDRLQVKILRVDTAERKIGLSKKRAEWTSEQEDAAGGPSRAATKARRGGLHGAGEGAAALIDGTEFLKPNPKDKAADSTESGEVGEVSVPEDTADTKKTADTEAVADATATAEAIVTSEVTSEEKATAEATETPEVAADEEKTE